jgi:cytidine deaminase
VLHRELARVAIAASKQAHSPYSKIRVGAALLTDDGLVSTGANVENASYGLTLCAERVALVKAVSEGARKFTTIAIATNTRRALTPCGACRQSLLEFAPDLRVLIVGRRGIEREFTLAELLPSAFEPGDLR